MGDITERLSRHEYACHCKCGLADPHPLLVVGGQEIVDKIEAPSIIVRSGSRCPVHNDKPAAEGGAGGSVGSQHKPQADRAGYTCGADYSFPGMGLDVVVVAAQRVAAFEGGGIGIYLDGRKGGVDRIHVDVRRGVARWGHVDGRKVSWRFALSELYRRF